MRDEAAFLQRHGVGHPIAGIFSGKLSNSEDRIKLSFGAGETIRDFTYFDQAPWPAGPDGNGYSLTLINPQSLPEHDDPFSWRQSRVLGGAPGMMDGLTFSGTHAALKTFAFDNRAPSLNFAGGAISFSIVTRLDADNLDFILEASQDMQDWSTSTAFLSRTSLTPIGNGFGNATYTGVIPPTYQKLFIRMKAEQIE